MVAALVPSLPAPMSQVILQNYPEVRPLKAFLHRARRQQQEL